MPRKPRSDSAQAAVEAMLNAAKDDLQPPMHVNLRTSDWPFWEGIIRSRARDEWSDNDLVVAAQLARAQADIEREQEKLDEEGSVVPNPRGTLVANPRVAVLQQLAGRQMAIMRSLRMAGAAQGGDARDLINKRRLESDSRRVKQGVEQEDEDLLA